MKIVRAERRSVRALETIILLAFVWGAVSVAISETGPSTRALGQVPEAPAGSPAPPAGEAPGAVEDAAARIYLQKCAGCHTVGRGKLTGPDLNEAATFPMPDLTRAIKSMEKKVGPLSDAEVATLADFLKDPKVKERIKAEEGRAAAAAVAALGPPSAEKGEALFTGREPFENGGASCASCHAVGGSGGTLGPDLTGVFAKLGEAPLASACEKTNFKVMSATYKDHPVTKQEALHLTRYFAAIDGTGAPRPDPAVGVYGAAAAVVGLGALALFYRKREPGVRKELVRRRYR